MYAYTYQHYTPVLVDPRLGGGFPHKTSDLQHGGYRGTAQPAQPFGNIGNDPGHPGPRNLT